MRVMRPQKKYFRTVLPLVFSCIPVAAYAAEGEEVVAENGSAERSLAIEEVMVTAQKRSQNIQDIPGSVTALYSEALEVGGIQDLSGLALRVPSMSVGQLYGSNSVTLRGISTSQTSGSEDPSVAVHVNGVYQARSRALDMAIMDLERVEVLAGPQGTLYGRNATGGVVNYVTKAPSPELEGNVSLGLGNYDTRTVKGTISGPISDELLFRLSGMFDDQGEGFTKNLHPGAPQKRLEDKRVRGARLALAYSPTDTLQFDLDMMYVDTDSTTFFGALAPSIDPNSVVNNFPQTFEPHEIYSDVDAKLNSVVEQVGLTVTWDVTDDWQLKSITSYQGFEDQMNLDLDATPVDAVSVFQSDWSETFTQEFNLSTQFFDERLTSIFGVFYYDDAFKVDSVVHFFTDPSLGGFDPIIYPSRIYTKSISAFMEHTFELRSDLRLIGGIRFNRDEKDSDQVPAFPCAGTSAAGCALEKKPSQSWSEWTPKVAIQYDFTDSVMVYAQYQKGFKAGGFVSNTAGDAYDPEYIEGPEIGVKSSLWDNRLRLNAAAWYYTYEDLQVQQNVGVGQFAVNNAAEATLKGLEVSVEANLTSQLSIDIAAMVQSSKYDEFETCDQTAFAGACTTEDTTTTSSLSGNWLNRAPPYTANIGLQYRFNLPNDAELLVRGESYWSGEIYYDEFNGEAIEQGAYSTQNLFVTFEPATRNYTARIYIKNIADEEYLVSGFWNSATSQYTGNWASPRTYGAEITYRF